MSEVAAAIDPEDPLLTTHFVLEIVRQMRAIDTYGTRDDWPVVRILEPFILTAEKKRQIPTVGDPDEITIARIQVFYNAICALIEKESGLMAVPLINLTHEGFGRVILTVGKLVVVDRTLRDAHRFGFSTLAKMQSEADKLLTSSLTLITNHSTVANL